MLFLVIISFALKLFFSFVSSASLAVKLLCSFASFVSFAVKLLANARHSSEDAVQIPPPRLPPLPVDPEHGMPRRLRDEVVALDVGPVPPARLDALGAGDERERAVVVMRF